MVWSKLVVVQFGCWFFSSVATGLWNTTQNVSTPHYHQPVINGKSFMPLLPMSNNPIDAEKAQMTQVSGYLMNFGPGTC